MLQIQNFYHVREKNKESIYFICWKWIHLQKLHLQAVLWTELLWFGRTNKKRGISCGNMSTRKPWIKPSAAVCKPWCHFLRFVFSTLTTNSHFSRDVIFWHLSLCWSTSLVATFFEFQKCLVVAVGSGFAVFDVVTGKLLTERRNAHRLKILHLQFIKERFVVILTFRSKIACHSQVLWSKFPCVLRVEVRTCRLIPENIFRSVFCAEKTVV